MPKSAQEETKFTEEESKDAIKTRSGEIKNTKKSIYQTQQI